MSLETIYIVRHGFRVNWITTNWKSVTGLSRDPPLAAFGEEQAREVASYFMSLPEDQRPTAIFSSPYCEKPTAVALGIPIYAEHGLSEWYSPVEPGTGLHPRPSSASALRAYFPEIDDSWSSVWYPTRKGETVLALHDRLAEFLAVFVSEVHRRFAGAHKRILLLSHAATVLALTHELVGDRELSFRAACCSLTVVDRKGAAPEAAGGGAAPRTVRGDWTARLLGDGGHLKDGLQRAWGFEDVQIKDGEVVNDHGVPGTEDEKDEPVGSQVIDLCSRM